MVHLLLHIPAVAFLKSRSEEPFHSH